MLTVKLIKKNGKLDYVDKKDKVKYNLFLDKVSEGDTVEIFFNIQTDKASTAQISKVHACIRQIAKELGYSFDDMKSMIKMKSGLTFLDGEDNVINKSFAECSKDEMSLTIQTCEDMARDNGIILG